MGKLAISPLPSWGSPTLGPGQKSAKVMWPTCDESGHTTPCRLGGGHAQRGQRNQKRLCDPHVGKVATSPLPSWRSPTFIAGTNIRKGYVHHMWAKWLHHPCRLRGVPNAQHGDKNEKRLCGPHVDKVATSPLPSWGSPTPKVVTKIRNGYAVYMLAKWLYHPCRLGGPQRSARGQKSEMAMWPTCGQSGYITPAVLGVPDAQRGNKNPKWLYGPHVGKVATSPLRGPHRSSR